MNQSSCPDNRHKELALLDSLAEGLLRSACAGDHKSARLIMEISARRTQLLGFDTPKKSLIEKEPYNAEELQSQYAILSRTSADISQTSMD